MNDTKAPKTPISDREAKLFAQVPANRDRFLAAIAERISPDRMQAVYLFPPIKQGVVETGVAVIAVDPVVPIPEPELELEAQDATPHADDAADGYLSEAEPEADDAADGFVSEDELAATDDIVDGAVYAPPPRVRPVVLTARYRHTLKGADRGKWFVEIIEQADAPLATVEMVVAGVTQRRDEATEPERLDADAVRAAVAAGTWTTPAR